MKDGLTAYDSLESLLADASVELVTIATPNDLHRPIAIQAMAAGKHVISEKPVTLSSRDLQAMIDASRKYGRIFSVHQNRRWDEDYSEIARIYDQNSLGRVFNIESRVHGSRGVPGDWRNTWLQGGGMILDWGVHMLDQLLMLVDEPVVSTFCTVSHVTNDEVDDGFKAIITFGNGLTAQVEVGTSNFINLPRWYMQGENGTAVIHDWALNGEIVKVSDWEKRDAVPVVTAAGLTKTMAPRTEETIQALPAAEGHFRRPRLLPQHRPRDPQRGKAARHPRADDARHAADGGVLQVRRGKRRRAHAHLTGRKKIARFSREIRWTRHRKPKGQFRPVLVRYGYRDGALFAPPPGRICIHNGGFFHEREHRGALRRALGRIRRVAPVGVRRARADALPSLQRPSRGHYARGRVVFLLGRH